MKKLIVLLVAAFTVNSSSTAQTMNNAGTSYPGTPSALNGTDSQVQTAQDNQVLFQGNNIFGSDALRNNIKVGIGVFNSPVNSVADRLHLNDITNSPVFSRYTNSLTAQTATDGLGIGIDASGHAVFNQFENLPIEFYTNATERMRILSNGAVGINDTAANNRLEITSAMGDPYFSSGASSGLRFTNLTNTSTPAANSSAVLSVDANGDVILVNSVATATSFASRNGLNSVVGSPSVELGGKLVHDTEVDQDNFNLVFNKKGRFGIGEFLTTSNLSDPFNGIITSFSGNNAKIVFDNGDFESTQANYAYRPSSSTATINPFIFGLRIRVQNDKATNANEGAFGSYAIVSSEGSNVGSALDVSSNIGNATGENVGYQATVSQNLQTIGGSFSCFQNSFYETATNAISYGVDAGTTGGNISKAVKASALNAIHNYGGYLTADQTGSPTTPYQENIGVFTNASNGTATNTGVYASASGRSGGSAECTGVFGYAEYGANVIGVYGKAPGNGTGNAGTNINLAGFFDGDVMVAGNCTVSGVGVIPGGVWTASDKQFKKDIQNMGSTLDKLMALQPKTYLFDKSKANGLIFPETKQYGFIAQELQQVIPEVVQEIVRPAITDPLTKEKKQEFKYLTVNYDELIPILIKGMQEQQQQIETLTQKVNDLSKQSGSDAKKTSAPATPAADADNRVDLSDENIVILGQNIPNPFMENTIINYTLPQTYTTAKIMFTNNEGSVVKTVDLATIHGNSLNVYATGLSHGIYSYSLIIDGKIMDTKKMIKE